MVTVPKAFSSDTDTWLATLPASWTPEQLAVVRRAHLLCHRFGSGRGLTAAALLADLRLDHEVIAAGLLHDALAEGAITLERVMEEFGPAVTRLVEGVSRLDLIGELHQQSRHASAQLESLRKMLLAMAEDVRVVLIQLAIRLSEMRELKTLPDEQCRRIAQETMDVFAPLANRLGMSRIKWELEDLALRHLEPAVYKRLANALEERRADRERYLAAVIGQLQVQLEKAHIEAEISGRVKHIYSIWRKMQGKQLPFEEIFDVRAVRILVDSVKDCYVALGVIHSLWNHIAKEFDDYVANPKSNGYQSLHTAVVGPKGKTLEVQIRTREMHHNAELGVAAHWRYKEGGASRGKVFEQQITWLRQMLEWKEEDPSDFLDRFKAEAFQDRVYVVTPRGNIVDLVQGATPLDFAYHIHTEVGHRCRGAKVNGRIVPLTYTLKNAEQVEVLTAKNGFPSRDWLNPHAGYLKSPRALSKVRHWFKQQDLEKNIAAGRSALERECQRLAIDFKQIDLQTVAEKLHFHKPGELFAAIGYGDITTINVVSKVQELILPPQRSESVPVTRKAPAAGGEIKIRGVGKLLTQLGRCCKPVPPEPIAGYITRGRGVTIHRQDCPNLLNLSSRHRERVIEVDWGEEAAATYAVDVQVDAHDRPGLLRDIAQVLANAKVNVLASNTVTDKETATARIGLTLEIINLEQFSRILVKIGQVSNVTGLRRKG